MFEINFRALISKIYLERKNTYEHFEKICIFSLVRQ